jgi:FAD/FMN-containing dehydrogenase
MTAGERAWQGLVADLTGGVEDEADFGAGAGAMYSTDASNYRQVAIGAVRQASVDDVVVAVAACRQHGAPVLPRGGRTAMAGQTTNAAVVIDWSRHLGRVIDVDPAARTATVKPGCVLDTLNQAAGQYGLTFGPDSAPTITALLAS